MLVSVSAAQLVVIQESTKTAMSNKNVDRDVIIELAGRICAALDNLVGYRELEPEDDYNAMYD